MAVSQEQRKGTSRRNKPIYNHVRSLCAAEPTIPSTQLGSLEMRICRARPQWLQYFKIQFDWRGLTLCDSLWLKSRCSPYTCRPDPTAVPWCVKVAPSQSGHWLGGFITNNNLHVKSELFRARPILKSRLFISHEIERTGGGRTGEEGSGQPSPPGAGARTLCRQH